MMIQKVTFVATVVICFSSNIALGWMPPPSNILPRTTTRLWEVRPLLASISTKHHHGHHHHQLQQQQQQSNWNPLNSNDDLIPVTTTKSSTTTTSNAAWVVAVATLAMMACPSIASAAATTTGSGNLVPSAFVAYGHYLSVLGMVSCVIIEKILIKPNMDEDEEFALLTTDTIFGVFGVLMLYTGYLRLTAYEKGFDYYSHEPIFWMKLLFVSIFAASSLFNTTTLVKRNFIDKTSTFVPISEQLAARMDRICNAELTALAIIPLTATFMSRGVLYETPNVPWQIEAAIPAIVFGGLGFKYIKEAITFDDNNNTPPPPSTRTTNSGRDLTTFYED